MATLTREYFDEALKTLANKGDVGIVQEDLREVKEDVRQVQHSMDSLHTSVDTYLKRTEDWHQEFSVLKARYDKLADTLTKKGFVKEEELAL